MQVDGYFYIGAAKELPGVRELFDKKKEKFEPKAKRGDLYKLVDGDYYGYRDEDDGLLEKLEAAAEKKGRWFVVHGGGSGGRGGAGLGEAGDSSSSVSSLSSFLFSTLPLPIYFIHLSISHNSLSLSILCPFSHTAITAVVREWQAANGGGSMEVESEENGDSGLISHVPLPSNEDIEKMILEKRKQELLSRYS